MKNDSTTINNSRNACVYVAEFGNHLVKIGRSIHPQKRVKSLASGSGRDVGRVWISSPTRLAWELEGRIHASLAESRGVGEWFMCSFEDAVSAAHREFLACDSDQTYSEINAQETLNPEIKNLFKAAINYEHSHAAEAYNKSFMNGMWGRAIKNCGVYLQYRDIAEKAYWIAVSEELESLPDLTSTPQEAKEIAMMMAYSDESYLAASRMENIHLGITMESCMLFTQDAKKIPAMLEEIEKIALQEAMSDEGSSVDMEDQE